MLKLTSRDRHIQYLWLPQKAPCRPFSQQFPEDMCLQPLIHEQTVLHLAQEIYPHFQEPFVPVLLFPQ